MDWRAPGVLAHALPLSARSTKCSIRRLFTAPQRRRGKRKQPLYPKQQMMRCRAMTTALHHIPHRAKTPRFPLQGVGGPGGSGKTTPPEIALQAMRDDCGLLIAITNDMHPGDQRLLSPSAARCPPERMLGGMQTGGSCQLPHRASREGLAPSTWEAIDDRTLGEFPSADISAGECSGDNAGRYLRPRAERPHHLRHRRRGQLPAKNPRRGGKARHLLRRPVRHQQNCDLAPYRGRQPGCDARRRAPSCTYAQDSAWPQAPFVTTKPQRHGRAWTMVVKFLSKVVIKGQPECIAHGGHQRGLPHAGELCSHKRSPGDGISMISGKLIRCLRQVWLNSPLPSVPDREPPSHLQFPAVCHTVT